MHCGKDKNPITSFFCSLSWRRGELPFFSSFENLLFFPITLPATAAACRHGKSKPSLVPYFVWLLIIGYFSTNSSLCGARIVQSAINVIVSSLLSSLKEQERVEDNEPAVVGPPVSQLPVAMVSQILHYHTLCECYFSTNSAWLMRRMNSWYVQIAKNLILPSLLSALILFEGTRKSWRRRTSSRAHRTGRDPRLRRKYRDSLPEQRHMPTWFISCPWVGVGPQRKMLRDVACQIHSLWEDDQRCLYLWHRCQTHNDCSRHCCCSLSCKCY